MNTDNTLMGAVISPNHPIDKAYDTWFNCHVIALDEVADSDLPASAEECVINGMDASRLAIKAGEQAYDNTLIFTTFHDGYVEVAMQVGDAEISTKFLSPEALGTHVKILRRMVLSQMIPEVKIAFKTDEEDGWIEIGKDLSGLHPSEGDPHVVWINSSDYSGEGQFDSHIREVWDALFHG